MTRSFEHEADLPHPVDHVWRALTDPQLMALWIMNFDQDEGEVATEFRPVAGATYRIDAKKGRGWRGYVVGKVLEVVPGRHMALAWSHSTYQDAHPARIEFTLTPSKSGKAGTRLDMVQSGFPGLKGWFVMQGARVGWRKMLDEGLPAVLAKPGGAGKA